MTVGSKFSDGSELDKADIKNLLTMTKETKIEKTIRELSDMNEFYKKNSKIKESKTIYSDERKSGKIAYSNFVF